MECFKFTTEATKERNKGINKCIDWKQLRSFKNIHKHSIHFFLISFLKFIELWNNACHTDSKLKTKVGFDL